MDAILDVPIELTEAFPYRILNPVGQGATSQVWRALCPASNAFVALKVARHLKWANLLADEAEQLIVADSSSIPRLLKLGRIPPGVPTLTPGLPFLALSWLDGDPLNLDLPLSNSLRHNLALVVARDIGLALQHLHDAGLAHGDIKPRNFLIKRDDNGFRCAFLIDLGFATSAHGSELRGATPRYLAPEAIAGRSVAAHWDLFSLGLVLAEILSPSLRAHDRPADRIALEHLPEPFATWCLALTAPDPGSRPSAAWIHASASRELGLDSPFRSNPSRQVRAAYFKVRQHELQKAARCSNISADPRAASWLHETLAVMQQAETLRGADLSSTATRIDPLGAADRLRWLVSLVGPSATTWRLDGQILQVSDSELGACLESLADRLTPKAWTFADVQASLSNSLPTTDLASHTVSDVDLALALVRRPVQHAVLELAEQGIKCGNYGLNHAVLLSDALRVTGELGRSFACLCRFADPQASAMRSDLLRRMGRRLEAASLAATLIDQQSPWADLARCVLARIAVDEGRPDESLELLTGLQGAYAAEVRALAFLAKNNRSAAVESLNNASAIALDDESQARLACVRGMEAHSRGEARLAFDAFSLAVSSAVRAGAVVEEATYRTGLAAAAVDAGFVDFALESSNRASLLWEHLGRRAPWAYALLAKASALAIVGSNLDSQLCAQLAQERAHDAGDHRAEAYALMALFDLAAPDSDDARSLILGAEELIKTADGSDDQIRIFSRKLACGLLSDELVISCDRLVQSESLSHTSRFEWWGARCSVALRKTSLGREDDLVGKVIRCLRESAPVAVRGPAILAAKQLAMRIGDGDFVRSLSIAQHQLSAQVLAHTPPEFLAGAQSVAWIEAPYSKANDSVDLAQVRDLENLVRALGQRENLRSLLEAVLDALVLWTGVERGILLLRAPDDRLVVRAARNVDRHDLKGAQLSLSLSLAQAALSTRAPVVAVDAAGEISEVHQSVHALGLRSVLAVPLIARGEALGVAYLDDRVRVGAFGPLELSWVNLVSVVAAVAIADARDQTLLRRAVRKSVRAQSRLSSSLAERDAQLQIASVELARAKDSSDSKYQYDAIIGRSDPIQMMLKLLDRITPTDVPVLVRGDSGVGKELVARALHFNGPRAKQAFVSENCSAVPESLLESTLFGHVRGAFTGADRPRIGLFEAADSGTLLLDEIGEMSPSMQSKLLRVLQEGEIHPVGCSRPRKVNVRVIAATHRDLSAMVEQGKFREDLFYRLNVITIDVPSLRERADDIPLLVQHFIQKYAGDRRVRVLVDAMAKLQQFSWPGNVRQLENELRRALVLCDDVIRVEHLSSALRQPSSGATVPCGLDIKSRVDSLEHELVCDALSRTRGNQTQAAVLLGLSRFGLQKMIKRLQINESEY